MHNKGKNIKICAKQTTNQRQTNKIHQKIFSLRLSYWLRSFSTFLLYIFGYSSKASYKRLLEKLKPPHVAHFSLVSVASFFTFFPVALHCVTDCICFVGFSFICCSFVDFLPPYCSHKKGQPLFDLQKKTNNNKNTGWKKHLFCF